ncbi:Mobile element protein [Rhodococcus sp. WAY2]|nr:Mobile element protein [Rhodococcus sp. WAY2]
MDGCHEHPQGRRRRHSALDYLAPVDFEQRLIASSTLPVAA